MGRDCIYGVGAVQLMTGSGRARRLGRAHHALRLSAHPRHGDPQLANRSQTALRLAQLEDMMHVLGMTTATRSRGRKPSSYWPVKTVADARRVMVEDVLHRVGGPEDER